jgi:hypothetical protein
MSKKNINLRAYFKAYDDTNKKATFLFLDEEAEPFTKKFLMSYYHWEQHNPIKDNEFYAKFNLKQTVCHLDKMCLVRIPIQELIGEVVQITIKLKHYQFNDQRGKRITGWNITIQEMHKI